MPTYVFAEYRFDTDLLELWHANARVHLTGRPAVVLKYLIENHNRWISRTDLAQGVWKRDFVEPGTIKSVITSIRKALGESAAQERFIKSIAYDGYRFVLPPSGPNPTASTGSLTIAEQLRRLGVSSDPIFRQLELRPHEVTIGDMISICALSDERGLKADRIRLRIDDQLPPLSKDFFEAQAKLPIPVDNRARAFVHEFMPALKDDDGIAHIDCGPANWLYVLALEECTDLLQRSILIGDLDLRSFPGFVGCHVTLVTSDLQLILLQRSKATHHDPLQWSVGIGANLDRELDDRPPWQADLSRSDENLGLQPLYTLYRELKEEIGLKRDDLRAADISFLHIGQSITNWAFNLFCHVELLVDSGYVRQAILTKSTDPGEHRYGAIEAVDFTLDKGLRLVVEGQVPGLRSLNKIATWARMGLLYSLIRQFGTDEVVARLSTYH